MVLQKFLGKNWGIYILHFAGFLLYTLWVKVTPIFLTRVSVTPEKGPPIWKRGKKVKKNFLENFGKNGFFYFIWVLYYLLGKIML